MNLAAIKSGIILPALFLLISFCGCATPEAKQGAEDTQLQTAGDKQVIVVPIFILSPPENGTPGNAGEIPPGPMAPEQTIHRGEPFSAKM